MYRQLGAAIEKEVRDSDGVPRAISRKGNIDQEARIRVGQLSKFCVPVHALVLTACVCVWECFCVCDCLCAARVCVCVCARAFFVAVRLCVCVCLCVYLLFGLVWSDSV